MMTFVLDFDSTFVTVESLDELGRMALREAPERQTRMAEIEQLTAAGMQGRMDFGESLAARLRLFAPNSEHIMELVKQLYGQVTPSMAAHKQWFEKNAERIYIVSGGFREYIVPVVREFGIAADHVLANRFVLGDHGEVVGYDQANPLAHDGGKVVAIRGLGLEGPVVMVGDGYNDLLVRDEGLADMFIAFVENVDRPEVSRQADMVAKSFERIVNLRRADVATRN